MIRRPLRLTFYIFYKYPRLCETLSLTNGNVP